VDLGQHQAHHVVKEARIAPEKAEDLGEDDAFLGAGDEDGLKCVVEVLTSVKACNGDGVDGIKDATGADWQARLAQRAGEMGDVVREFAVFRNVEGRVGGHHAGTSSRLTSSSRRPASRP
jgi:hypothetical protein